MYPNVIAVEVRHYDRKSDMRPQQRFVCRHVIGKASPANLGAAKALVEKLTCDPVWVWDDPGTYQRARQTQVGVACEIILTY